MYKPISFYPEDECSHNENVQFDSSLNDFNHHSRLQAYGKARTQLFCCKMSWNSQSFATVDYLEKMTAKKWIAAMAHLSIFSLLVFE